MRGTKLHGLLGCTTMQLCQRHLAYTLYQPSPVILVIGDYQTPEVSFCMARRSQPENYLADLEIANVISFGQSGHVQHG